MSKNLLQDIVKTKHIEKETIELRGKSYSGSRYALWAVAAVSLVFLFFAFSYMFSKAVITLNPKMQDVVLDENLSASLVGNTGALPFDLIVISGEENKMLQTSEEKDFSEKAEGIVLIYNTFSSKTQRLDIDTRLMGSNGKIYKTKKQIIVPGMKGSTPGSIEVDVVAAEGGEEYNSGPLDLTIIGFKGTPKFSKFYAISNIDDKATKGEIKGGLKGKFPVISPAEKTNAVNEMKQALRDKLLNKAIDQIPEGFVLFKDAVYLNTEDINIDFTAAKDNILPIKLKGELHGVLFDEGKLAKKIAENKIDKYDDSPVYISNMEDLTFHLPAPEAISSQDVKNISFNLKGTAKIVWKIDDIGLTADLLGKNKKNFNQILSQYPNIDSANLTLRPFWKLSIPDKTKDISMIVNYPP